MHIFLPSFSVYNSRKSNITLLNTRGKAFSGVHTGLNTIPQLQKVNQNFLENNFLY